MSGEAFPVASAGGVGDLHKVADQRKQERERVLGHGGVVHAGAEGEGNAHLGGGLDVDFVHSDAIFAQDFEARRGFFQYGAGDQVVTAQDGVKITHQFQHALLAERPALADDLDAGGFEQFMVGAGNILIGRGGEQNADLAHG